MNKSKGHVDRDEQLRAEEILGRIKLPMKGWVDEFSKKGFLKSGIFGTTQKRMASVGDRIVLSSPTSLRDLIAWLIINSNDCN